MLRQTVVTAEGIYSETRARKQVCPGAPLQPVGC